MLFRFLKTKPSITHFPKSKKRSFTLVELLVIIAIVGLLSALIIIAVNQALIKGRDARRMGDIKQITNALELAYAFNDSYPIPDGNTTVCLSDCTSSNWCANLITQMSSIPNDPLPNQQCYLYNSDGKDFRVAATFEASSNDTIAQSDGGLYDEYFEGQSTPGQISLLIAKYASAAGGNWSSDTGTWVIGSGGSIVTDHPVAGDTVYLDANSGAVTVDVASACDNITATGYTGTLTLSAGLTIYGNLLFVAGMTFTPGTQTVTFAATTTGKTITTGGKSFYNVTWNGSGDWTLQDNFTVSGSIAMTLGTLNLNGKTLSKGGSGQTLTLGNGFTLNIGTGAFSTGNNLKLVVPTGAIVTASTGAFIGVSLTVSGTGTWTFTGAGYVYLNGDNGTLAISSSNWTPATSTIYIASGSYTITVNTNQPLYNFVVGRAGVNASSAVVLQANLTVQNDFTILYYAGRIRTFNAGSYTINVGGNWANGDTFTAGTSTVNFNDATKTSTISGTTTFYNFTSTTPNKAIRFTAGTTQTFTSFALTGTAGNLITIDTNTGASTFTLSDGAGTNQIYYTSVTRSAAGGGATWNALVADGNVDGGGNTGWVF